MLPNVILNFFAELQDWFHQTLAEDFFAIYDPIHYIKKLVRNLAQHCNQYMKYYVYIDMALHAPLHGGRDSSVGIVCDSW